MPQKYEYRVLVRSLKDVRLTVAQLYRDRSDVEITLDEFKNQWGWGGFKTKDLERTRAIVRMNALFCNWWSVHARMVDPDTRREAKTSRRMMMDGVARVMRHGRNTRLMLMDDCAPCGDRTAVIARGDGPLLAGTL